MHSAIEHLARASRLSKLVALLGVAAFATSPGVRAAELYCTGLVSEHLVYADGTLMVSTTWLTGWTYLCNLQSPWKGVSTEACFSWFSLVTAARTNNKPVGLYYDSTQTCATLPSYGNAPAPIYVRMGP
jgi:hypothetical protein